MERANRPNGFTVPEEYAASRDTMRHQADDDIRVQLSDIRKEVEETNRILKSIQESLGGKR